ncbi:MAG: MMPL family transporter [Paludibacteraceae bacterium]|nr:MMPL family transporter [Paludibacteraceae bacterium]
MLKTSLLHIYDWLQNHHKWLVGCVVAVLVPLIVLAVTLRYNEDIFDFLPATEEEKQALNELQAQQSAARLVLVIEGEEEDLRYDAQDAIEERLAMSGYQLEEFDLSDLSNYQLSIVNYQLSIIPSPEAIRATLERDKAILNTPGGSSLAPLIQQDPFIDLSTFHSPLSTTQRNYAYVESPYGATETKRNAALVDSLQAIAEEVAKVYPNLHIRWTGAPVISVGNAQRIKTDTMLCISLSLVLIIGLLTYAFPRKRDIFLILLAVSFGWLVGMAVLRIVTPSVSAIVLGIGSVLIGIAVNYPLHLLVHQRYTTSVRQTLEEVLSPLVIGNITTVGAFLALIPLQATAMRHLGFFAASMLIGTILFCIFILPHLMSAEPTPIREIKMVHGKCLNRKWFVQPSIILLTLLLGGYLLVNGKWTNGTWFDSDMRHINYMTAEQREDMSAFNLNEPTVNCQLSTINSQEVETLIATLQQEAEEVGFKPEAFEPFYTRLRQSASNEQIVNNQMVNILVSLLSAEFDYLGLVCSIIVFAFLWISFRRFGLALIAFIPMALSWVWILAIMQLFGLQFNIVNIILATFIFGQGDDYTIFIVEGLLYEYRTGKPILPQYRQSILLSALIMLVGIGILVFAVHPAMHSLGLIALIGMSIVLLMAVTVPPLLFRLYQRFFTLPK